MGRGEGAKSSNGWGEWQVVIRNRHEGETSIKLRLRLGVVLAVPRTAVTTKSIAINSDDVFRQVLWQSDE